MSVHVQGGLADWLRVWPHDLDRQNAIDRTFVSCDSENFHNWLGCRVYPAVGGSRKAGTVAIIGNCRSLARSCGLGLAIVSAEVP